MILGGNCIREPDCCQKVSTIIDDKKIILINTPDLQHPNLCGEKLTKFGKDLMRLSDPGPHLFLLVLQPENFTEEEKERLQFILQMFDSPSNHTLTLISTSKQETSDVREKYVQDSLLGEFLSECKHEFIQNDELQRSKLWKTINQILEENHGKNVGFHQNTSAHLELPSCHGNQEQEKEERNTLDVVKQAGMQKNTFEMTSHQ